MSSMTEILQAVADGAMTPEEASAAIEELRRQGAQVIPTDATPVQRIIIKGGAARLVVIGDPNVREAVAEGPHKMVREGDALLVTTNMAEGEFSTEAPRSALMNWLSGVVDRVGATLTVRVNPYLPLQVLVVGGALDLTGVRAGAAIGVEAGAAKVEASSGPLTLDVISGSARVDWTFTGESRVNVDMGSANVTVRPDSDVTIVGEATLGQAVVKAHDGIRKAAGDMATEPVVVGAGTGSLRAVTRMGSVQVTLA